MIKIITFAFILVSVSVSSFRIQSTLQDQSDSVIQAFPNNLQFNNYTGSCITSAMVSYYIQTINEAASLYKDSWGKNIDYIQSRLEGAYSNYFEVILMPVNETGGYDLYSIGMCSVVSWSGVNNLYPKWVYIIIALSSNLPTKYITQFSHGSGVEDRKYSQISTIITNLDGNFTCNCSRMAQMTAGFKNLDGNTWNIVCKPLAALSMISNIRVSGDRWNLLCPNKCEYLVWTV